MIFGSVIALLGAFVFLMASRISSDEDIRIGTGTLRLLATPLFLIGIGLVVWSTAEYVEADKTGLVSVKFGTALPQGDIIATNGEKGPQAYVLPPGWHFWYWPWQYEIKLADTIEIQKGMIGVVTAKDGKPLPDGEIYAPEWESSLDMLDGMKFLKSENGHKGPQLTVLTPGTYRYNPNLFDIKTAPALDVPIGQVAVIKANAGERYIPEEMSETPEDARKRATKAVEAQLAKDGITILSQEEYDKFEKKDLAVTEAQKQKLIDEYKLPKLYKEGYEEVNGVPIVPNGHRGIWQKALTPNQYYLHPDAYVVTLVKTTNRMYNYTDESTLGTKDRPGQNDSIGVKTKDGYKFPVDVRASVKISAQDAPYVVAMLADPDADEDRDGFDTLEEIVTKPTIRAIFRNNAETSGALEYINSRSEIEKSATRQFSTALSIYRLETDGLYVGDIGLDKTPEGAELLATQTDREKATQEIDTWKQKTAAQVARAESVRAEAEAENEKTLVEAEIKKKAAKDEADALIEVARGKAGGAKQEIEAVGGFENYVLLKVSELVAESWNGNVPQTVVAGGSGEGLNTAVLSQMLKQLTSSKSYIEAERLAKREAQKATNSTTR